MQKPDKHGYEQNMIRLAAETDREQILELFRIMWKESETWIPNRLQLPSVPEAWRGHYASLASDPAVKIAVFERDGIVLAVGCLKLEDRVALISDVVVHPAYRHQRIGSRMLAWLETEACRAGVDAIDVEVAKGNSALSVYNKAGYETIMTRMRKIHNKAGASDA